MPGPEREIIEHENVLTRRGDQWRDRALRIETASRNLAAALERIAAGTWNNKPGKDQTAVEFARSALQAFNEAVGDTDARS